MSSPRNVPAARHGSAVEDPAQAHAYTYLPRRQALSRHRAASALHVIEALDSLGAGFSLASHDNGHPRAPATCSARSSSARSARSGSSSISSLLEGRRSPPPAEGLAVRGLRRRAGTPQINLGMTGPDPGKTNVGDHVDSGWNSTAASGRLVDRQEIARSSRPNLIDRFGPLPNEVEKICSNSSRSSGCAKQAGIERLGGRAQGRRSSSSANHSFPPAGQLSRQRNISRQAGTIKIEAGHKLVYMRAWDSPKQRNDRRTAVWSRTNSRI